MADTPEEKTRSWIAEYWPDFDTFVADMDDARASEHVTVLVGSTMLDLVVRRILAAFMVDDKGVMNGMLGKSGGGQEPLASFSSRIKASYAFGLIAADERDALDAIREIRNALAHRLSDQISEQSLTDKANNAAKFVLPSDAYDEMRKQPRQAILRQTIVSLALTLVGRIKQVSEQRRTAWAGGRVSLWAAAHTAPTPPFGQDEKSS